MSLWQKIMSWFGRQTRSFARNTVYVNGVKIQDDISIARNGKPLYAGRYSKAPAAIRREADTESRKIEESLKRMEKEFFP